MMLASPESHVTEESDMRMLVQAKLPNEPFSAAVRNGTAGKTIEKILGELKPEAVYFAEWDGQRCAIMIVDLSDPSRIPAIAEPWFLSFNAEVTFHVMMTPEDLGRAGLEDIGKKW
jgi:hypothetical protein